MKVLIFVLGMLAGILFAEIVRAIKRKIRLMARDINQLINEGNITGVAA